MSLPLGEAAAGRPPAAAVSPGASAWVEGVRYPSARMRRAKLKRALPTGAGPVAVGLLVSGASAYAFLAVTARLLGPPRYAPLAAFWSLTFLVGPGCFGILEKETGRQLSSGAALDVREGPVVRRTGMLGALLCLVLVLLTVATGPVSTPRLFDGDGLLVAAFAISLPAMWAQHLSWGTLAGNGRFGSYGTVTAAEGLVRLAGCGGLVLAGAASAAPFGFVVALAPLAAAAVVVPALRDSNRMGPLVPLRTVSGSLGWLLVSSLLSSVLVNAGPIAVSLLATPADRDQTGRFLTGLVLVRVPLFLYNSASATLLPALSARAAERDWLAFRSTLLRLAALASAIGLVAVVGAAGIGPAVLRLVFGPKFVLPSLDLALLAASAGALLVATTLSVAMTATGTLPSLAGAWASGVATLVVVLGAVGPLLWRVELGLFLGSLVSATVMAGWLSVFLRTRGRRDSVSSSRRRKQLEASGQ